MALRRGTRWGRWTRMGVSPIGRKVLGVPRGNRRFGIVTGNFPLCLFESQHMSLYAARASIQRLGRIGALACNPENRPWRPVGIEPNGFEAVCVMHCVSPQKKEDCCPADGSVPIADRPWVLFNNCKHWARDCVKE